MLFRSGLSIVALGQRWGKDPLDVFFDLALAENLQTHFVGKFFQNVDDGVAPSKMHPVSCEPSPPFPRGQRPSIVDEMVRYTGH